MAQKQTYKRVKKEESPSSKKEKTTKNSDSTSKKTSTNSKSANTKTEEKKTANYVSKVLIFASIGVLIFLAIIVDIVSHINGETVILGSLTKPIMGLFGISTPAIGAYFIVFAYYCYKYKNDSPTKNAKGVLLVFNIIFLLGTLHILNGFFTDIPVSVKDLWANGTEWHGCGIIGGYIGWFFGKLLHVSVGFIFGIAAFFVSFVLFIGKSPIKILKYISQKIKGFFKFIFRKINDSIENRSQNDDKIIEEKNDSEQEKAKDITKKQLDKKIKSADKIEAPDAETEKKTETTITSYQTQRTENYVTGSIYDAYIRKESPKEESKEEISAENSNSDEKVKNRFGFRMGREARDEFSEETAENDEIQQPHDTEEETEEENLDMEKEEIFEDIGEIPEYIYPSYDLLEKGKEEAVFDASEVEQKKRILLATLEAFKVKADVVNISCGPTITRYEIEPEMGVSVKSIEKLGKDLALRLAAKSLRIEAPIPGKCAVGIEVSNNDRLTVKLRDILDSPVFRDNKSKLFCCLGVDVAGNAVYFDIPKMPHLLIAGATGMGKSVCLNCIIVSLLYRASPSDVRLILIDPKKVEFSHYSDIPHLLTPVVTNINKCAASLSWAVSEMERRYDIFESCSLRNLEEYHAYTADDENAEKLPYIVIVIDELADLMMQVGAEVENSICRLAQKARAAGMYLILGTQRPSVDVITGLIKANIPSRISLAVTSQVDSRTILDTAGAENLLDKGDILFAPAGARKALRVQGAFISTRELNSICDFVRENSKPLYDQNIVNKINDEANMAGKKKAKKSDSDEKPENDTKDLELMVAALEVGFESGTISTSYIQRRLSFGYAKAARVVDMLQQNGFVSTPDPTTKLRKIIISPQEFAELKLNGKTSSEATEDENEE